MARGRERPATLLAGTEDWATLGAWLDGCVELYAHHRAALGQVATGAHDEALYLLLRTLRLPLESDASILARPISRSEAAELRAVFHRRLIEHVPAAYLTREAWLGEHRFYVDERVIIPRSYFLEILPTTWYERRWEPSQVRRVVDVCTGSGCLAILLAHHFPRARVDAIDLSADALAVAAINVQAYGLEERVSLHRSDVFAAVPPAKYDVILSNPPYEPSAHVDALPPEFHREPRMALDGGRDGLAIIRALLRQARSRLQPHGVVLIEVGGLRESMEREFADLEPQWLPTADGTDCVCLIEAKRLIPPPDRRAASQRGDRKNPS